MYNTFSSRKIHILVWFGVQQRKNNNIFVIYFEKCKQQLLGHTSYCNVLKHLRKKCKMSVMQTCVLENINYIFFKVPLRQLQENEFNVNQILKPAES